MTKILLLYSRRILPGSHEDALRSSQPQRQDADQSGIGTGEDPDDHDPDFDDVDSDPDDDTEICVVDDNCSAVMYYPHNAAAPPAGDGELPDQAGHNPEDVRNEDADKGLEQNGTARNYVGGVVTNTRSY